MTTPDPQCVEAAARWLCRNAGFDPDRIYAGAPGWHGHRSAARELFAALSAADAIQPPQRDEVLRDALSVLLVQARKIVGWQASKTHYPAWHAAIRQAEAALATTTDAAGGGS